MIDNLGANLLYVVNQISKKEEKTDIEYYLENIIDDINAIKRNIDYNIRKILEEKEPKNEIFLLLKAYVKSHIKSEYLYLLELEKLLPALLLTKRAANLKEVYLWKELIREMKKKDFPRVIELDDELLITIADMAYNLSSGAIDRKIILNTTNLLSSVFVEYTMTKIRYSLTVISNCIVEIFPGFENIFDNIKTLLYKHIDDLEYLTKKYSKDLETYLKVRYLINLDANNTIIDEITKILNSYFSIDKLFEAVSRARKYIADDNPQNEIAKVLKDVVIVLSHQEGKAIAYLDLFDLLVNYYLAQNNKPILIDDTFVDVLDPNWLKYYYYRKIFKRAASVFRRYAEILRNLIIFFLAEKYNDFEYLLDSLEAAATILERL